MHRHKQNDCHYTLEEIATDLDITRERVRQIKKVALAKLKHKMRDYAPDSIDR
jgi:DNA-directed RNA polymerase sigma subunit (sigma70/sigma32)